MTAFTLSLTSTGGDSQTQLPGAKKATASSDLNLIPIELHSNRMRGTNRCPLDLSLPY